MAAQGWLWMAARVLTHAVAAMMVTLTTETPSPCSRKWCARIPTTPHPLGSQSVSCCHRAQGSDESFLLASTSFVVCRDTCAQLGRSIGSQPACLSEAWSRSSPCAAAKLSTVGKRGCRTRPELAERLAMLPPRHVSWLDMLW